MQIKLFVCPTCKEEISYWENHPCIVCKEFLEKLSKGEFRHMSGEEIYQAYGHGIYTAVNFVKAIKDKYGGTNND